MLTCNQYVCVLQPQIHPFNTTLCDGIDGDRTTNATQMNFGSVRKKKRANDDENAEAPRSLYGRLSKRLSRGCLRYTSCIHFIALTYLCPLCLNLSRFGFLESWLRVARRKVVM